MNLKYRVYSVSSQSPQHPASSLVQCQSDRPQPQFWQSQLNPSYPQQLTIQFYIPVRTKSISLTMHPYKIPQKMEIFIKYGNTQKYQKLGYVKPSNNEQSHFMERQRKTIFVEYPCTYLKIIMHQNYRNNRNLFDQVAIWDLTVEGDCLAIADIADLNYDCSETDEEGQSQVAESDKQSTSKFQDPQSLMMAVNKQTNNDRNKSSMFPQVFKILQSVKAQAVQKQDFEKASQIKWAILNFKEIQKQITSLQQQKRKALLDEDYDKCHRLKNDIVKKKDQANFKIKQLQEHYLDNMSEAHSRLIPHSYHPTPMRESVPGIVLHQSNTGNATHPEDTPYSPVPNRSRNYHNNYSQQQHQQYTNRSVNNQSNYYDSNAKHDYKYESQVVPALKKKIEQQFNSVSNNNNNNNSAINISSSRVNQSVHSSYQPTNSALHNNANSNRVYNNQQQPIANLVKNPNKNAYQLANIQQYIEESIDFRHYQVSHIIADYPKLQPVDFKADKKYQPYYDYIEPDLWRMALTEQYWKLKGYALDKVMNYEIEQGYHVQALVELVAIIIQDHHPVNIKKCLLLLEKLVNIQDKNYQFVQQTTTRYSIQTILTYLLQLQTDTKEEFRKLSSQIYKNLPDFSIVSLQQSIRLIIKHSNSASINTHSTNVANNNKRKHNAKQLLPKIHLVQYFVQTYIDTQLMFGDIIKWGVSMLEDPDSQVKNTVIKLLLEVAFRDRQHYTKIKQYIMKKKNKNQIWANFQSHYQQQSRLSEVPGNYNQSGKQITEHSQDDIHKKQTIMKRNKNKKNKLLTHDADDAMSHLQKMQESPIPSPNKMKDSAEIQLAYSQESLFQQNSHQSHSWFANKQNNNNLNNDKSAELRVMQAFDNQLEGHCQYCYQQIDAQIDMSEHLLYNCPVLLPCTLCNGHIYLRELNQHWLSKCPNKQHQQCPRCKVAIDISEINEHKARNTCRKVNKNSSYCDDDSDDVNKNQVQICPLCEDDVQADDFAWVEHSEKCFGVGQIKQKWKNREKYQNIEQ